MSCKLFAVVYQMGKVASTSLVANLNHNPDVTAVQSHFLGLHALREILPSMLSSGLGDYFYAHQFGQFKTNVEVTRRINLILDGVSKERLLILSLARDPLDWFRSSLVQDMEAYAPQLIEYATRNGLAGESDEETVCAALQDALLYFTNILHLRGGIDPHFDKQKQGHPVSFAGTPLADDQALQHIFRMMLRPYRWFEDHFERALPVKLSAFKKSELAFVNSAENADYVIIRYEDISSTFVPTMLSIGLTVPLNLEQKNTSYAKPYATATQNAFASEAGLALSALTKDCKYARFFAY